MKYLTIGELAKAAAVPTTTVRYYERAGLLVPEARTGGNYRSYGPQSLERLRFIRSAQGAGLSLADVAELIRLTGGDEKLCGDVQTILLARIKEVDQKLLDLKQVRDQLATTLETCSCAPQGGLCQEIDRLKKVRN